MKTIIKLPQQLADVTTEQAEHAKGAVEQELTAIDTLISEIELKRRHPLFGEGYQRRRGYDEMHRQGFGKTVVFDTERCGRLSFRTSIATSDYANTDICYATPDSPMGRLCRSAKLGWQHESPKWGDYTIVEIRNFGRFTGIDAADNIRNFRVMEAESIAVDASAPFDYVVSNLQASLKRWVKQPEVAEETTIQPAQPTMPAVELDFDFDNAELLADIEEETQSNFDIFGRSDTVQDDYYGLSHYFFLNPTDEQLEIMTNSPTVGPMLVEGVAGSGKTCAALGRAKSLCDLALSPDEQQYNGDFVVESNIGFVRTGELVQYLKASCLELGISDLPIHEYAELEHRLSHSRNLFIETRKKTKTNEPDADAQGDETALEDETLLDEESDDIEALVDTVLTAVSTEPSTQNDVTESSDLPVNAVSYKYHNLAEQPDYDVHAETTMAWLKTISAVIGWRIAGELRKQQDTIAIPTQLQTNDFLAKHDNGKALLDIVQERLRVVYQPILAQLSGETPASFALDRLMQQLHVAQHQLSQELFDDKKKWVNPAKGQWRAAGELKQNLQQLRAEGAVFVESDGRSIKAVLVLQPHDLSNLFAQGAQVFVSATETEKLVSELDEVWVALAQGELSLEGRFPGEPSVAVRYMPKLEDFEFLVATHALLARREKRVFKVVDSNPFCRILMVGSKKTSLAKLLKQQLRRVYRKWQFADLYRDALLNPYAGDDAQNETHRARFKANAPFLQAAASRLQARQLAPHDKDLLLCLAQVMTRELSTQAQVPAHLYVLPAYRSVFIDEVQDFTEQQIFLMAQQADPKYHAVTLVGDMHQQLGRGNVTDLNACFPLQPLHKYLLKENKRQERQPQLAAMSMLFRALVQQDQRIQQQEQLAIWQQQSAQGSSAEFRQLAWPDIDRALVNVIADEPFGRTIAVICPEQSMAEKIEARVRGLLAAQSNRLPHVSDRIDLSKKYMVHFSAAENTKGLEFDTVILAGLECVDWHNVHQLNKVYVGLSRARKKLVMFGQSEQLPAVVRRCLLPGSLLPSSEKEFN